MKTMKPILTVGLCLSLMIASACTTQKLWDNVNPHEEVWVSASDVTEQQLIDKKIPYHESNGELGKGYLIPKSKVRQMGDYTIRTLATPVTVTLDVVSVVAPLVSYK